MATEKELAVREIYKKRMGEQSASKGRQNPMLCAGTSQPTANGRSAVYGSLSTAEKLTSGRWERRA